MRRDFRRETEDIGNNNVYYLVLDIIPASRYKNNRYLFSSAIARKLTQYTLGIDLDVL